MKLMGNDGTIFLLSNGNGTICYPVDKTNRRVTLNKVYCVFTRMINEQMLDHKMRFCLHDICLINVKDCNQPLW